MNLQFLKCGLGSTKVTVILFKVLQGQTVFIITRHYFCFLHSHFLTSVYHCNILNAEPSIRVQLSSTKPDKIVKNSINLFTEVYFRKYFS